MLWIGLCITLWAWCLLSLGLPRHHQAVFLRPPTPARRRALRIIGWALLGVGFAWFVGGEGWELGATSWSAALMLSAIAWVLSMALAPRRSLAVPMLVSTAAATSWLMGVG